MNFNSTPIGGWKGDGERWEKFRKSRTKESRKTRRLIFYEFQSPMSGGGRKALHLTFFLRFYSLSLRRVTNVRGVGGEGRIIPC